MWHVDIVIDLQWFADSKGNLGQPKSRARQKIPNSEIENEFLLYGNEGSVRHLRVMLHTDQTEPPHDIVDANIHRWVSLLEVASGIAAPNTATTASLGPNTSAMIVLLGQGDETVAPCSSTPSMPRHPMSITKGWRGSWRPGRPNFGFTSST